MSWLCTVTIVVGSSYTKDMYKLYAVIQNWLLALYEHFMDVHVCYLGTKVCGMYMLHFLRHKDPGIPQLRHLFPIA